MYQAEFKVKVKGKIWEDTKGIKINLFDSQEKSKEYMNNLSKKIANAESTEVRYELINEEGYKLGQGHYIAPDSIWEFLK